MHNVLVVDDSRAMRALLSSILSRWNATVFSATSAEDALSQLETIETLDVVLIDWNMPGMSGLELLEKIRSEGNHLTTPVLMVTSESEMSRVETAIGMGANEYLMKPFTPETLQQKLSMMGIVVDSVDT